MNTNQLQLKEWLAELDKDSLLDLADSLNWINSIMIDQGVMFGALMIAANDEVQDRWAR